MPPATEEQASYVGGFVCAEGSFTRSGNSFRFAVALGATDADSCSQLADFFGVGTISHSPRRRAHYDDEVSYQVQALPDLVDVVVPFMDAHLPASYKRTSTWPGGRPCSSTGRSKPGG